MKIKNIKISLALLKMILTETLKGKSLERILMNYVSGKLELSGLVVDLGSGSPKASYYRFLKRKKKAKIIHTDFYQKNPTMMKLDLEKSFPIEGNKFDYVICFNVLEHVYNYKNVIQESYRILKNSGIFIGSTPFLVNYHPDPNDYFRYTHQALIKIFKESGFICQEMVYLGFGPFSAGLSQWIPLLPRVVRPLFVFPCIMFDILLNKLSKYYRAKHALGYIYVFKK